MSNTETFLDVVKREGVERALLLHGFRLSNLTDKELFEARDNVKYAREHDMLTQEILSRIQKIL